MAKTPTLIWAQRVEKVFVTWECLSTKDVNVTLSEGLLTVEGTAGNGDQYKLVWGRGRPSEVGRRCPGTEVQLNGNC